MDAWMEAMVRGASGFLGLTVSAAVKAITLKKQYTQQNLSSVNVLLLRKCFECQSC